MEIVFFWIHISLCRLGLKDAMSLRQVKPLEDAMNFVKSSGFEQELQPEMIEANNLLLRLRRLERIRAEILELKQSTVAEIRSYSAPPAIVQSVMIATFLLLGHPEKETKVCGFHWGAVCLRGREFDKSWFS